MNDSIPIKPGTPIEALSTPIVVIADKTKVESIDALYAMIDGARTRLYPGTGSQVPLDQLDGAVLYVGGSVGLGENDVDAFVDLVDGAGNWTSTKLGELFTSTAWPRLSDAARARIMAMLQHSAFAKTIDDELLQRLPADIAAIFRAEREGDGHA